MTNKLKGRLMILLMTVIGLAPLVGAAISYHYADQWRPETTSNNGTLITPVRQIQTASLPLLGGGRLSADWFKDRWSLVYIGPDNCPVYCRKALYLTRQIRLTMAAKMHRVQRMFIVTGTPEKPHALRRAHPDLTVVIAASDAGQHFLSQFPRQTDELGDTIWLVDPQGRLMMKYELDGAKKGIIVASGAADDLRHLLRY